MGIRVVFLDLDGVLNNHGYLLAHSKDGWDPNGLDPKNIKQLNELLNWTGAKVVISSTWRLFHTLPHIETLLTAEGFEGEVIGKTPDLRGRPRGEEIQAWLETTDVDVERFVILDDDSDMGALMPHLVRTSFSVGLTAAEVDAAAKVLLA